MLMKSYSNNPVIGIDASHHNNNIDWQFESSQGFSFAIIKCTEGTSFLDPKFESNWNNLLNQENGFKRRGAYHFFHPEDDPKKQANWFISILQSHGFSKSDWLAIDVEYNLDYLGTQEVCQSLDTFLTTLTKAFPSKEYSLPIIYTFQEFWDSQLNSTNFSHYPLWIADWVEQELIDTIIPTIQTQPAKLPMGWNDYFIWQYSAYLFDTDKATLPDEYRNAVNYNMPGNPNMVNYDMLNPKLIV